VLDEVELGVLTLLPVDVEPDDRALGVPDPELGVRVSQEKKGILLLAVELGVLVQPLDRGVLLPLLEVGVLAFTQPELLGVLGVVSLPELGVFKKQLGGGLELGAGWLSLEVETLAVSSGVGPACLLGVLNILSAKLLSEAENEGPVEKLIELRFEEMENNPGLRRSGVLLEDTAMVLDMASVNHS